MTADNVRKYLPSYPAKSKGRMKRPRTGIRSTRPKKTTKEHEKIIDMIPTPKSSSKVIINTTETNNIHTHGPNTIPFKD